MVRLLLELGADARIVCNRDVSPLMMTDEGAVCLLLKAQTRWEPQGVDDGVRAASCAGDAVTLLQGSMLLGDGGTTGCKE